MIFLVPLVFKQDFFHTILIFNYLIKILKPNKLMFKNELDKLNTWMSLNILSINIVKQLICY